jgi:hypothetical protein
MTKKDVGPIRHFGGIISEYSGEEISNKVMEGSSGIAKASKDEVYEWIQGAIERFDNLVDENTRIKIMEQCGYNCAKMNENHIERMKKKREKFASLDEFIETEIRNPSKIQRIERAGDQIFQIYSPKNYGKGWRCFCSLWQNLPDDEQTSRTWCHCSKAFLEKTWEMYAGKAVKVELVKSSISGGKECKFEIFL